MSNERKPESQGYPEHWRHCLEDFEEFKKDYYQAFGSDARILTNDDKASFRCGWLRAYHRSQTVGVDQKEVINSAVNGKEGGA